MFVEPQLLKRDVSKSSKSKPKDFEIIAVLELKLKYLHVESPQGAESSCLDHACCDWWTVRCSAFFKIYFSVRRKSTNHREIPVLRYPRVAI